MKKYLVLSLLIHAGAVGAYWIWSGHSVVDLLGVFSKEQTSSVDVQEDQTKKNKISTPPQKKKVIRTVKKIQKKVYDKSLKTKKSPEKDPPLRPVSDSLVSQKEPEVTGENSALDSSTSSQSQKEEKQVDEELLKHDSNELKSSSKDMDSEKKVAEDLKNQKKLLVEEGNSQNEYPVAYNSKNTSNNNVEKSIDQKNEEEDQFFEDEEDLEEKNEISQASNSSVTEDDVIDRNFEDINTNPQELENLVQDKKSYQLPVSSNSQALIPVQGNPQPVYPQQAREQKTEGSVFLLYFVDDTGLVDKIQLLRSSGHTVLDNEALRIMARQRYQPGQSGWYKHRVDFKLENM